MSECCSVTQRKWWVFGCGTFFVILGLLMSFLWPYAANTIIDSSLVLSPGTDNYNNWQNAPIPIYLEVTLFNWTNPDQVRNHNVKPNFVEMGPYVYIETHEKVKLDWHKNDTVSYYQKRTWHFVPEKSNGTLDDMVTAAHVISATVADMMKNKNIVYKKLINMILNTQGGAMAVTKTAREWIFDGYSDKLIDFLKKLKKINIPYTKFGWLVDRNGSETYDGRFTINTGVDNVEKVGMLTHWNGLTDTGFYPQPCDTVNGTAGDIFPPNLDIHKDLTIFATDACRFLNLIPSGSMNRFGIDGNIWLGTAETLGGTEFPNQKCFCTPGDDCPKKAVVEVKKCRAGAPIYTSFPHFYLADKSYVENISGLNPQKEKHQFKLSIEPQTGIPLEIQARLQINMQMQPVQDFDIYKGVQKFTMPMFWFTQRAELDEKLANRAKLALHLSSYGVYAGSALASIGVIIIFIGQLIILIAKWRSNQVEDDEEPLTNDSSIITQ